MNFELLADRTRAIRVPCPETRCNAQIGEHCINVHTGQPLAYLPAHDARLRNAGVLHAPLDSRDLRKG